MHLASVVLLARRQRSEFLWVKRPYDHVFLGGYWSLVGGGVDDDDVASEHDTDVVCAQRELREELGLEIELARFEPFGSWTTPEMFAIRYTSKFFVIDVDDDVLRQPETAIDDEAIDAEWTTVVDALRSIDDASRVVSPPIRLIIDQLAAGALDISRDDEIDTVRPFEVCRGVHVFPLKTDTLPPAQTTNCVVVGEADYAIVDPGTDDATELARLTRFLAERGGAPRAVILTHHHPDHVGGASALARDFGIPIWAHPRCGEFTDITVSRTLEDRERLDFAGVEVVVHHTPGHAPDHIALQVVEPNVVIGGDLIASFGTILVSPPHGEMGAYLRSLETIRDLDARMLVPAHGWVVPEPKHRLQYYLDHRRARELKILDALRQIETGTAADIVPIAYSDTPQRAWPLAELSTRAHLAHLVVQGAAIANADGSFSA